MKTYKYEDILREELYDMLDKKENEILYIKENINVLEEELNILKLKDKKITKTKKKFTKNIIILVYNLVYLIAIISYVYPFINGFALVNKIIYKIVLYTGVTIISLTISILFAKIENKLIEKRKDIHKYLQKQIGEKINKIELCKQKELEIEKDIIQITNSIKEEQYKVKEDEEEKNITINKEREVKQKTRKRTKNINST